MIETYERVVNRRPFTVRRRVRWSDCDPAGVVYTGQFVEYVLSAVNLFYGNLAEGGYRQWAKALGVVTPCRGLSMDFRADLWPDDECLLTVRVSAIRRSSFELQVHAKQDNGREVFEARFSPICMPSGGERKSAELPAAYREALLAHLAPMPGAIED